MIYIVKDIILKLVEYAELNQTAPVSFSSLNLKKHKPILDNLQQHDMIQRGKRLLENEQRPFIDRHKGSGLLQRYLGTL